MKCLKLLIGCALLFTCILAQSQKLYTPLSKVNNNGNYTVRKPVMLEDSTIEGPDWEEIKEKLVVGGGIGLSLFNSGGTNFTLFQISPQVGYKLHENVIVGTGVQFLSISSRQSSYLEYGPDLFLRVHVLDVLFLQGQFEYLNFEDYLLPGKRVWNPAMLAGFGYGTYGYSLGLYTCLNNNRFTDQLYPGNILLGKRGFFIRGQILFNLVD